MKIKLLCIVAVVVSIKFLLNLQRYLRIKQLHKYFDEFLNNKRKDMHSYKQEVVSLFEQAHIKDVITPISEHIGYGQIVNAPVSVISMFPTKRAIFAAEHLNMFDAAEGVFHKNMLDAINPLYWVEVIIFLPRTVLTYIGLDAEKTAYKLCNVLLTFIWWLLGVSITFFWPQLQQLMIKLLGGS